MSRRRAGLDAPASTTTRTGRSARAGRVVTGMVAGRGGAVGATIARRAGGGRARPCTIMHSEGDRSCLLATEVPYWVCAYANNQHDLASAIPADPKESSFYKAMQECDVHANLARRESVRQQRTVEILRKLSDY